MNPVYTRDQLEAKKRPQLWVICETLGLPKHASNAKCVEAILEVQPVKVEVKTEFTTEEVNDSTVVYASGNAIAVIAYNDNAHLPYTVTVGGKEVHSAATWAACYGFITWHYKQGTLPIPQPMQIDEQAVAQFELNAYIEKQSQTIVKRFQKTGIVLVVAAVIASWGTTVSFARTVSFASKQQCQDKGGGRRENSTSCVTTAVAIKKPLKPTPTKPIADDKYVPSNNGMPNTTRGSGSR